MILFGTKLSIGVFDSGMGGLTVLRALKSQLPQESFIYLGDTARLPYGTKSPETVKQYAVQMTKILMERRIKALVIACNTATTAALPHLQAIFPDIPVIGVVCPGAEAVIAATSNQRIMIFATETTIASQVYQQFILEKLHSPKHFSARAMFGEYALYADKKVVALVCDDQLYVKVVPASSDLEKICEKGSPYPGAKPHYIVEEDQLSKLQELPAMLLDISKSLPAPKKKKRT